MTFRTELENLINEHCMENGSNTPDYVLAQFIDNMLMAFDIAVNSRETHFGRDKVKDKYEVPIDKVFDFSNDIEV
jgi:hypothetical protein